jgi:DNA polymerase II small subunit/DNA polymerase delta subunit B
MSHVIWISTGQLIFSGLNHQIAAAMPVDIMPGVNDPANFSLPQQV